MKSKLVLWGKGPEEKKVLLGLSLNEDTKKVDIYIFPEEVITVDLENTLHKNWKSGDEVNFPAEVQKIEKELSLVNELIPEGYSVERDDLVKRAQTEWQFVILSSMLYRTYNSELEEIKDRIESAQAYTNHQWDELKSFWDKVQVQIVERNLFRDHANSLRSASNELFSMLKEKRKDLDKVFNEESKSNFDAFNNRLQEIEEKITKGLSLHVVFEDLKKIQSEYRDLKLNKDHRNKLWDRIDHYFKEVKEKRFGNKPGGGDSSALTRLDSRLKGLQDAIQKMERSIKRDKQERDQQSKGTDSVFGQLEMQLREAKMSMIDERIGSKETKLQDMIKTREELEAKKSKLAARAEKDKELAEAKKQAEAKIAAEIKEAAEQRKDEDEKLEKLAAEITSKKPESTAPAEVVASDDNMQEVKSQEEE